MNDGPCLLTQRSDARLPDRTADATRWLSAAEQDEFGRLRDVRRRREWLAGRWLLKRAVTRALTKVGMSGAEWRLSEVEIFSRDALGRGQPPRAVVAGKFLPWHLSLAHDGEIVWAAISTDPRVRVGVDVVSETSTHRIVQDLFFTDEELRWLRDSNDGSLASTLWAVKEAVYKATNRGEPFAPARISVRPDTAGGVTCSSDGVPLGTASISIRRSRGSIVVVATADNTSTRMTP